MNYNYNKKVFAAVQVYEIVNDQKKYYAYILPISASDNAIYKLQIKNIVAANIFITKKAAAEVVTAWRAGFKANNNYLFDAPAF